MTLKKETSKISKSISIHGLDHPKFERLVGDVIHKMKNNLGGISGFATLLERDVGEESPHVRMIEQIQTSVMRLDDLVVDLMVLIRKPKFSREEISLKPLLNDIISQYQERNHLKCKVEYQTHSNIEKVILNTDGFVFERVLLYVVRFVEHANAILKKIIVTQDVDKSTNIHFKIDHIDLDDCTNKHLMDALSEYEPVEARLAFAILIKLMESLHGHVKVICNSNTSIELNVEIS